MESTPGRGSTFRVLLPVAGTAEAREPSGIGRVQRSGEPESRRVLVIDDEPEVIEALVRTIGPSHTIERAGSGMRALELLAQDAGYDVIFCDLMMPELTGMDLHEVVASKYPELLERMVFMTAGGFTPRAIAFVDQHGPRCIEKPFSPETVRACLR